VQEKIFTVEATINAVNAKYGWYYISCSEDNCKKQLDKNYDHYFCKKCNKKAHPKTR
jgi:ribosomal protein L37AE/L43A